MSIVPYYLLWLILAVAALGAGLLGERSRLAGVLGPVAIVAAGLAWWLGRPDEPVLAGLGGWRWAIDESAWQLTGLLLLLALATSLLNLLASFQPLTDQSRDEVERSRIPVILGLTVASLPVLWAGEARTLALGYALLALVWFLVARPARHSEVEGNATDGRDFLILAPVLLIWLAAAWADPLVGAGWATATLLAAGSVAAGVFPVGGWRTVAERVSPEVGSFLLAMPVLAGAKLLLPLAESDGLGGTLLGIATAFGLITVLVAIYKLFSSQNGLAGMSTAVAAALAGMVVLAAVWAGTDGLLAIVRVAILAPALLRLVTRLETPSEPAPVSSHFSPARLGLGIVLAALASVPLTAGFRGIGGIYESWIALGGWALVIVTVLLLTLLIAVATVRGLDVVGGRVYASGRKDWLRLAPLLLLGLGMLYPAVVWLSGLNPLTWAAILIGPLVGIGLAFILRQQPQLGAAVDEMIPHLPERWGAHPAMTGGRRLAASLGDATADALAILEGPYGLLWVLVLFGLLVLLA